MNPCGRLDWRERANGLYEVGGETPAYEPGSARFDNALRTFENFRSDFFGASQRTGIPVSWLIAIASVETGPWSTEASRQASIVSSAGAIGIMQIMPATADMLGYSPAAMTDPGTNIEAGAVLLRQLAERISGGLPALTGVYNSGKLCCSDPRCGADCSNPFGLCTDSDYPGAAIRYNNTALLHFDLRQSGVVAGVVIAGVGLYAAAVLAGLTKAPEPLRRLLG